MPGPRQAFRIDGAAVGGELGRDGKLALAVGDADDEAHVAIVASVWPGVTSACRSSAPPQPGYQSLRPIGKAAQTGASAVRSGLTET